MQEKGLFFVLYKTGMETIHVTCGNNHSEHFLQIFSFSRLQFPHRSGWCSIYLQP